MTAPASATGSTLPTEPGQLSPPTPAPTDLPADAPPHAEKIAQAAASGLMTHADVDEAVVIIDGPINAPQLLIDCVLAEEGNFPRATEVTTTIHDQIESLLDVTFDTADVTVRNVP